MPFVSRQLERLYNLNEESGHGTVLFYLDKPANAHYLRVRWTDPALVKGNLGVQHVVVKAED